MIWEGFEGDNAQLATTLRAFSATLAGTASTFSDPTFGNSLATANSLSFPEWDTVNTILADMKSRGTVYPYSEDLKANPYLADKQSTVTASTNADAETPPFPGANSFTESQARSRIEDRGFTNVSGLKKDDQGIWRGTAMKDGKAVAVALDYKGNVVAH